MGIFLTVVAIAIVLAIYIRYSQNLKLKKALSQEENMTLDLLHENLKNNKQFRIAHEFMGADMESLLALDILHKEIAYISADKQSIEYFPFNDLLEVTRWEDDKLIKKVAKREYADAMLSGEEAYEISSDDTPQNIRSINLELTFSNGTLKKKRVNFLPSTDPLTKAEKVYEPNDIERDSIERKVDEWEILLTSVIKDEL